MTARSGKPRRFSGLPAALGLLTILVSCRTLPEHPDPNIVDWLPEDIDVAVRISVPGNEELTSMLASTAGLEEGGSEKALERTALAAFGMELADPAVHVAAVGIWPRGVMGSVLGPAWSKSPEAKHRWTGPGEFEVAAVSREEILLSDGSLEDMLARREDGSRLIAIARSADVARDADLAAWILDPEVFADAFPSLPLTGRDGDPLVSSAILVLRRSEDGTYDLEARAYVAEEGLSRSLALVLRLALSARLGTSGDREKRDLLSRTAVEAGSGEVRLLMPGLPLEAIRGFLEESSLFPEVEE